MGQDEYGQEQRPLTLRTYRDSAFVERRAWQGIKVASASFRFPAMTPPREWKAVVGGDGIAEWAIPWTEVQQVPNGAWAELWLNGACYKKGTVARRGTLPT